VIEVVECEGAPRDLGLDQGLSCRAFLTDAFRSEPPWQRLRFWAGVGSAKAQRIGRDLRRFFPAQAETIDAMAHAARVPRSWIIERFVDSKGLLPIREPLALAAGSARTGEGGLLAGNLPVDVIARRCRPDHGFASIEISQPWAAAPLAGVNEMGISMMCIWEGGEFDSSGCQAPASLLAQDCLRRFDHLDGAVEWLLNRPGSGRSTLLLADRAGEIVSVQIKGNDRTVFRPADGLIVHAGETHPIDELEKALREPPRLAASNLPLDFGAPMVSVEAASCSLVVRGTASASDTVRIGICGG